MAAVSGLPDAMTIPLLIAVWELELVNACTCAVIWSVVGLATSSCLIGAASWFSAELTLLDLKVAVG